MLAAISEAVLAGAEAATGERPPTIERITWHEAMERFESTSPTCASAWSSSSLTDAFAGTEFKAFAAAGGDQGHQRQGCGGEYGRSQLDKLTDRAKALGAKGLVWLKASADGTLDSPVAKFLSAGEVAAITERLAVSDGDLVLIVADEWGTTCEVLGQLRNDLGRPPVWEGPYRYVWVVDFPMFVGVDGETGRPKPGHHPFTQPHPDDVELLERDPMRVRSQAYDLVLNGWEAGSARSGSTTATSSAGLRRHRQSTRRRPRKFGFFLNLFEYGAPPHGGFAFGIDRLVAILAGEENIREVIAFPKTQSGADPMTDSPSPVAARARSAGHPCGMAATKANRWWARAASAFDGAGQALAEVALEDEVDDGHRDRDDHRGHHDRVPLVGLPTRRQAGSVDGAQLVAVGGDQRVEELVPPRRWRGWSG